MARETVKNLKEVQDLADSILNNVDSLDGKFSNAADAVMDMAAELEKSAKYSKENLSNARQIANMGKRVIDAAKNEGILGRAKLLQNKIILSNLGRRLGLQKNLTDQQGLKMKLATEDSGS